MTVSDALVGRLVDGRYQVEARLARGGMATVYRAVDTRLDRTVALKVMLPDLAQDDEAVRRFIREAKSAARLAHPDTVAVFDQGRDGDIVFLAMEYVEGQTLRDLLRKQGRLSPRAALRLLQPVLTALGAAHAAGIVHRDVKPENVLLADDGRVKVADFGLARAAHASNDTAAKGVLLGTVAYLAPEQVERGIADARSDVYAAGIVLYEMVTGQKPFSGDSPVQVAYQHVHSSVPVPSSVRPGLPAAVDRLVARATARDPDQRPADASRFLAEVTTDLTGLPPERSSERDEDVERTQVVPILPQRVPAKPRARRRRGGQPGRPAVRGGRVGLLAVLLLAAVLAVAGWWLGAGRYTDAPDLVNLTQAEAAARADAAGLDVEVADDGVFSETIEKGRVAQTDPEPGGRVTRGGTVTLTLSKGPELYAVPQLRSKTEDEARRELESLNLVVGKIDRRYHNEIRSGEVISTDPKAGTKLRRSTAVSLVVSRGPQPVGVPDVVGDTATQARSRLTDLGLEVTVKEVYDDRRAAGRVIAQSPSGGRQAFQGDTVTLTVSKGPEMVTVPNVKDKSLDAARKTLEDLGFKVRVIDVPGGSNKVLSQSPSAGERKRKGSTVTLWVF